MKVVNYIGIPVRNRAQSRSITWKRRNGPPSINIPSNRDAALSRTREFRENRLPKPRGLCWLLRQPVELVVRERCQIKHSLQ